MSVDAVSEADTTAGAASTDGSGFGSGGRPRMLRRSSVSYFCMPARSAWPGRGTVRRSIGLSMGHGDNVSAQRAASAFCRCSATGAPVVSLDSYYRDLEHIPFRDITAIGPAGSINSSVREMAQWVALHLGNGEHAGKRIVQATTLQVWQFPKTCVHKSAA